MQITSRLEKIESSGLIRLVQAEPELEYMFRHALVQDATYESLLKADRRSLHHAVGRTLESLYAGRLDEIAATLAMHFERAEEPDKALLYLVQAGEAAMRVYAVEEASGLFGHALELVPPGYAEDRLIHLYSQYGRVLELAGRFDAAIEIYTRMRDEGISRKSLRMQLVALLACGILYSTPTPLQDTDRAQEISDQALVIARELGDREAESRIYWILMLACLFTGRVRQSVVYGEQSLEIARSLDNLERLAFTLNDLARCYGADAQPDKAQAANREALALWEKLGNLPMWVDALNTHAEDLFMSGKLDESLEVVRRAYDTSISIHNAWGQAYSLFILSIIYWECGDVAHAIQVCKELLALDPRQTFPPAPIGALGILTDIHLELGETEGAYRYSREAYASLKLMKAEFQAPIFAAWARLEVRGRNLAEAQKMLDQALAHYDPENFVTFSPMYVALAQYELCAARGEYEEGVRHLDEHIQLLYRTNVLFCVPEHLYRKAQGLAALGRRDDAIALLEEAVAFWRPLSFRRTLWKMYALLADLEQAAGQTERAEKHRQTARELLGYLLEHSPADLGAALAQLPAAQALRAVS